MFCFGRFHMDTFALDDLNNIRAERLISDN